MSEVLIREAKPEDAQAIYALACDLAAAVGDSQPGIEDVKARFLELLEGDRSPVLVAESGDGVVGAASLWIKPDLAHGDTVVEVPMLVVAESARREGVGRRLMDEVQKLAAENEANLIELIATSANVAAREFYRSFGFVETDHVALEFVGDVEEPPDPEEDDAQA